MTEQRDWIALDTAVHKLTRPWSDVLGPRESGTGKYRPVDYKPLLTMLAEAKASSLGRTSAGRSPAAERSLLNLEAFTLWEDIDGRVRSWLSELSKERHRGELPELVVRLAGLVKALHAANQIPDSTADRIAGLFPRWCDRIWGLFDPPTVKNLVGACPACSAVEYVALDGAKTTALIAYYWKGLTPEAKCQCCGEHWAGEKALLELGWHIGATVDETALREMGVVS